MSKMRAPRNTFRDINRVLHRAGIHAQAEREEPETPNQKGARCDGGIQCDVLGGTGRFGLP